VKNTKKQRWTQSMSAGVQHELVAGKSGASLQDRFEVAERLMNSSAPRPATASSTESATASMMTGAAAPSSTDPVTFMPLESIGLRDDALRQVHEAHALDLALSIAAVGLIHFPVVNTRGEVIAGSQRLAALEFLSLFRTLPPNDIRRLYSYGQADDGGGDTDDEILTDEQVALLQAGFERHFPRGIPVHRIDLDALPVATQALTIETIENEKRLDFSKAELSNLVSRLKAAGFRDRAGRPRVGERTLAAELERITGKSRRTVFRLLEELRGPPATTGERAPSETSRAIGRALAEQLGMQVSIREHKKKRGEGAIVIRYRSFQERADALRKMGLKS
jgi:hypothetical protein